MADHSYRSRNTPPKLRDRLNANAFSNTVCVLAIVSGVVLFADYLIPDDKVILSNALSYNPDWSRISISILLTVGGMLTWFGVLQRKLFGKPLAPLTTIIAEELGWLTLSFGWGSTSFAVLANGRPGATLSLITMVALTIGCVWKFALLHELESQVREEIEAMHRTADALNVLGRSGQ